MTAAAPRPLLTVVTDYFDNSVGSVPSNRYHLERRCFVGFHCYRLLALQLFLLGNLWPIELDYSGKWLICVDSKG